MLVRKVLLATLAGFGAAPCDGQLCADERTGPRPDWEMLVADVAFDLQPFEHLRALVDVDESTDLP
jgi:hypothetical protein